MTRAYKRGDKWVAEWPVGKRDGHYRYQRKGGFTDSKTALKYAWAQVGQPSVAPNEYTVEAFVRLWLAEYAALLGARTAYNYEQQAMAYVLPYIGSKRLRDLSAPVIRGLYATLRKAGSHEPTLLKVHRQLVLMFRHAVEWQLLAVSPTTGVAAPKPTRVPMDYYTPEQCVAVLEAAKGTPVYRMLLLITFTGLSRSEIRGLQWRDLQGDELQVRRTRQKIKGVDMVLPTKRERRQRTVVLEQDVLDQLEPRGIGENWIVPEGIDLLTYWMRKASEQAGLGKEARFHMLRHNAASLALGNRVSLAAVSEMLGHSDPSITARIYAHALPGHQRETARVVGEAVRSALLSLDHKSAEIVPVPEWRNGSATDL